MKLKLLLSALLCLLLAGVPALASVPNTVSQNAYTADGTTTTYTFTWRLIDPTQMFVQLNGVTQSTSTYSVFQNPNGIGGTVVFNSAPASSAAILIERNSDFLQGNSLPTSGPLPPFTVESMFDKCTILCQQLENQIVNSGTLPLNPAVGSLLVGTGTGWVVLSPPSIDGQVLTHRAASTNQTDWETPTGGGGGTNGTVNIGNAGQIAMYPISSNQVSGENTLTAGQMLPLTAGQVYLGNPSNVVTPVTPTGDVLISSSGVTSLTTSGPGSGTTAFPSSITLDTKGRVSAITGGRFVSSGNTPTAGSTIAVPHLLGLVPKHCWATLKCLTTQGNWAVGDEVNLNGSVSFTSSTAGPTTAQGCCVYSDGTNENCIISAQGILILNKTSGAAVAVTPADWSLLLYAEP